jgi:hypothetical protein
MSIDAFFQDLDRAWAHGSALKIQLHVLGSTALMLQAGYERGTKDGDILETAIVSGRTKERLLALAGEGTPFAERHRVYLDGNRSRPGLPDLCRWPI